MSRLPCHRCATPLEAGDLRCTTCGLVAVEAALPPPSTVQARVLRCDGCGASLQWDATARAVRCGFCGGALDIDTLDDPLEVAEALLPFTVSPEEARAALRAWLGRQGIFRSKHLASEASVSELRPLWWAAWMVDARALVSWVADSDADARRARWAPHAGQAKLAVRDLVVPATRGLKAGECDTLIPHYLPDTAAAPPLDDPPHAVVESFGIPRSEARRRVRRGLERTARARARRDWIPGRRFRKIHVETLLTDLRVRRLGLPAHVIAWRYGGRVFRAVVHGQDASRITGRTPVSPWRVAAAIALGLLGVGALVAAAAFFAAFFASS